MGSSDQHVGTVNSAHTQTPATTLQPHEIEQFLKYLSTTRSHGDPRILIVKGGWTGSGGGGRSCFSSSEAADQFFTNQNLSGLLWVEPLEVVSARKLGKALIMPFPSESVEIFLERWIRETIEPVSLTLAKRIRTALTLVNTSVWINRPFLPLVRDAAIPLKELGRVVGWDPKCRYTQFVVRMAQSNLGDVQETVLLADYNLLNFQNPQVSYQETIRNAAILRLHEALYVIKVEIAANLSLGVHNLIVHLMSQEFADFIKKARRVDHEKRVAELLKKNFFLDFAIFRAKSSHVIRTDVLQQWQREVLAAMHRLERLKATESVFSAGYEEDVLQRVLVTLRQDRAAAFVHATGIVEIALSHYKLTRLQDLYSTNFERARHSQKVLCASIEYIKRIAPAYPNSSELINLALQYCKENGVTYSPDFYNEETSER
jgi:hypothetical protein